MKKRLLTLIALLVLSLACSTTDFTAALIASHAAATNSPTPALETGVSGTILDATATKTATAYVVCTGDEAGRLRVRKDAGTNSAVVALLNEGLAVEVIDAKTLSVGGTWAEIEDPEGWVNKRYLCEVKK